LFSPLHSAGEGTGQAVVVLIKGGGGKDMKKIGIKVNGRTYLGTVVKRTYNPKRYHVYVPALCETIEVERTSKYGHALVDIASEEEEVVG